VGERLYEKCNDTEVSRIDHNQMAVSVDCYSPTPTKAPTAQAALTKIISGQQW
jgi:hypothetical protein